jgi:drug/metabolite transporter (DMT)-like permease
MCGSLPCRSRNAQHATPFTVQFDIFFGRDDMATGGMHMYGWTCFINPRESDSMLIFWFVAFYVLQIVAALLFKFGASDAAQFWRAFILSNVLCGVSIYFVMKIYSVMQVNLAAAIAAGGAFVAIQLALIFVYRERLTGVQYAGLLAIAAGIVLVSAGKTPELKSTAAYADSARS